MLEDIMMPGNERIPLTYIVDVGESSRGLVETVQDSLPEELRHYAMYKRIKTQKEAINPLEFSMGLRYPLNYEMRQMTAFF